jgi:site-specific recombinase XerC
MKPLAPFRSADVLPALIAAAGDRARVRFIEFFTANIRNPHTRRAYARSVAEFLAWCERARVPSIAAVQPVHVATYIERLGRRDDDPLSAPTIEQQLAAIRQLFDWLVVGQVVPVNRAASVRGPTHIVTKGKTPVLSPDEARRLIDSIDATTHVGLRDRALIGLMVYSFARVGAALAMKVGDVFPQDRRLWVRLREKGGRRHEMPCHHNLETYLHAYIDGTGISEDPKGPLFRTIGRTTNQHLGCRVSPRAPRSRPSGTRFNDVTPPAIEGAPGQPRPARIGFSPHPQFRLGLPIRVILRELLQPRPAFGGFGLDGLGARRLWP